MLKVFDKRISIITFVWAFSPLILLGQDGDFFTPPDNPQKVRAHKVKGKISVDGKLSEDDWGEAKATTDFFRVEPRQGGPYKYWSSVKVLYDEKNIYFGVFARDSLGEKGLRVQDLRRDFAWGENDIFGIQLDPQNLK